MANNKPNSAETMPEDSAETMPENPVAAVSKKEKMYEIKIPLTEKEKGDVPVFINDRSWLIKRGVYVKVPECVYEVLRNREAALETAYAFEEKNVSKQ